MENLIFGGHATKRGFQSGGITSKVAELGGGTNLWMCSPKEYHQIFFCRNGVCASKNTLKKSPQTILKKGGVFQNPPRYRISQNPPPPPVPILSHSEQQFIGSPQWTSKPTPAGQCIHVFILCQPCM